MPTLLFEEPIKFIAHGHIFKRMRYIQEMVLLINSCIVASSSLASQTQPTPVRIIFSITPRVILKAIRAGNGWV